MSSSAGVVTLLFTDLVASTELLARVGDDAAEELRRVHFGLLRNAISTGGGQEVKTLGDGLMVAFTSSLQAIRSAVAIQQATEEHNGRNPELALRVRIGLSAGEFRCVLIVGDPGVGKTRLGAELLGRHRGDAIGLSARAHSLGTTSAFGVWAEALERHLRTMDGPDIERLCAGSLDDLAQLLRRVAAISGRRPEGDPPRSRLLEGLAVVTANLAEDQPVVVVIDDVRNADPSSLEALDYTAHSCMDDQILVVLTARSGEISGGSAAGEILLGLEQEGLLRRLRLGPLREDGLQELAATVAEQTVPETLVA